MQAKKSTKILSALSMAALSALGAKAAHGATLNLYYGQDPLYANSNNSVQVGTGYNPAGNTIGVATADATGGLFYFSSATLPVVSQTSTTTITVPVGDYLSLAIDAVLTGNSNPDGGKTTGTGKKTSQVQPSFLGLSELSTGVTSTDASGSILNPLAGSSTPLSSFNGHPTFTSTAVINPGPGFTAGSLGPNGGALANAYNVVPTWSATKQGADVSPGFNGNVGLNGFTTGGNTTVATTSAAGVNEAEQFASQSNTASYGAATDFADSLIFQGMSAGVVTLSPFVRSAGSAYWSLATPGSSTSASGYTPTTFGGNDVINNTPKLVIVVTSGVTSTTAPTSHAIVALAATANSNYGTTITNGTGVSQGTFTPPSANTLTLTGGAGKYNIAQVTGISTNAGAATGNVNVSGWNPASDPEIFGVDVKVNGTNASPSQLATLIAAIGGAGVPASTGVVASTVDPTGVLAALDTATTSYNLFLTFAAGGPGAADNLNLDLSTANDAALSGYTFSAVSVVPEPVSLGLLAIGGLGLMSRRTRRKS